MLADRNAAACHDLVQVYESAGGPVHALRGISTDFPVGSLTAVMGSSGAGKSTFLRLIACLERPTVGEVIIDGAPTAQLTGRARQRLVARQIGYVFQTPSDNLLSYLSVVEHVRMAWRMRAPEPPGAVDELLDLTGLAELAKSRPTGLAAGEQQRLAFAMAVAARPALVIADEPTASLDPAGAEALAALLPVLVAGGQTLVICTHDSIVTDAATRVLLLSNGTLAAESDRGGELLSVLDGADRIQLPRGMTGLFPGRRVRLTAYPDHVRIERP
ncbi:MAG TPA: ATP-binding cassette domain-containing protein [Acidimicrobiales bacterium]|jgi:ABC-type lipoprotein export system ATPase subunit